MENLLKIMEQLRDKEKGCPWDIKQDFKSIANFTIEEAYEVLDAINRGDMKDLCDELGDLLLQVVFHSQIAKELDYFTFSDVVEAITKKMIRRHPHVFGDMDRDEWANNWSKYWEGEKAIERSEKKKIESALDDICNAAPALVKASKIQSRMAKTGFNWNSNEAAFEKIREEFSELEEAVKNNKESSIKEEIGDLLFAAVTLANRYHISSEDALRDTCLKVEKRFRAVEKHCKEKEIKLKAENLQNMLEIWQSAK